MPRQIVSSGWGTKPTSEAAKASVKACHRGARWGLSACQAKGKSRTAQRAFSKSITPSVNSGIGAKYTRAPALAKCIATRAARVP
ncbi:MAG: hypothetical protein EBR73_13790 [Rhodobacteraceae bacterium]|nr:hypothetical protein [Paracoccaceae bacterium]